MLKQEYRRLLKSKATIPSMIALLIFYISSFVISYETKLMWIGQRTSTSPDLNREALEHIISESTGPNFLYEFWFVSDFFTVCIMAMFIWVGVFLSSALQSQKETGMGNQIIVRSGYPRYVRSVLGAQTLYIFTVITLTTLIAAFIAFIWGGGKWSGKELYGFSPLDTGIMVVVQALIMGLALSLVNAVSLMMNLWFKNKYLIQALPILAFFLVPYVVCSTLGNLFVPLGEVLIPFIPLQQFRLIDYVLQENLTAASIVYSLIPFIAYGVLFGVLYYFNIKKHKESYL